MLCFFWRAQLTEFLKKQQTSPLHYQTEWSFGCWDREPKTLLRRTAPAPDTSHTQECSGKNNIAFEKLQMFDLCLCYQGSDEDCWKAICNKNIVSLSNSSVAS